MHLKGNKRREIKELNIFYYLNDTYVSSSSIVVCIAKISGQSKICYFNHKVLRN